MWTWLVLMLLFPTVSLAQDMAVELEEDADSVRMGFIDPGGVYTVELWV
ncbi:MAG: hypothetical protein JRJ84_18375, partial [Deltaproteobacteria bacterium]|nr:hypothetical protein [Deltaproteobacteria bacterium]